MTLMMPDALRRKFKKKPKAKPESVSIPPERKRVGKTLRAVGGLCFDYLTEQVVWKREKSDKKALRTAFAVEFEALLREQESARFDDTAEVRRYGNICIEDRDGMPHYLMLTLKRMDSMPKVHWPVTTAIWIDVHPNGIKVRVRDKDVQFWQSLRSCLDRRRKAKK